MSFYILHNCKMNQVIDLCLFLDSKSLTPIKKYYILFVTWKIMNFFNTIALVSFKQVSMYKYGIEYKSLYKKNLQYFVNQQPLYVQRPDTIYYTRHKLLMATDVVYRFNKVNFPTISLFRELINKYCQQTIFISYVGSKTHIYYNKILKMDSNVEREQRKKIIFHFSKAIFNYSIVVNTYLNFYFNKNKNVLITWPIKYAWKKHLCFLQLFRSLMRPSRHSVSCNFSSNFLKMLENSNIPLFTVTNNLKQLVISEPTEAIEKKNKIKDLVYRLFYRASFSAQDQADIHESWFFVNPEDASEYKAYVATKYKRSCQHNGLNLFISGIHLYYRLNRTSTSQLQFRLFPDLTEVSKLVMSSSYRFNVEFDQNQKYGKNYFQGQPIYFIKPVFHRTHKNAKKEFIYCYYQIPKDLSKTKYYPIFFSKQVALSTWKKFRKAMIQENLLLPNKPVLHVYNLEDFLKDNEYNSYWMRHKFLFVPSYKVYVLIKSMQTSSQYKTKSNIYSILSSYLFCSKIWSHRIILSLINRHPPM